MSAVYHQNHINASIHNKHAIRIALCVRGAIHSPPRVNAWLPNEIGQHTHIQQTTTTTATQKKVDCRHTIDKIRMGLCRCVRAIELLYYFTHAAWGNAERPSIVAK